MKGALGVVTAVSRIEADRAALAKRQPKADREAVSHNLNGQKLGRKGRVTRERILAATIELINESPDAQISLSAVARRAGLGMTSLYVYFSDLTELLMAVLEPVMREAGEPGGYFNLLANYWPDEYLEESCRDFVRSYFEFWEKHSRILHLRNNMSDQYDQRMMLARVRSAQPVIALFRKQLAAPGKHIDGVGGDMASVLMTGIERAVTVATDQIGPTFFEPELGPRNTNVVEPLSRLMFLAARDCRQISAAS